MAGEVEEAGEVEVRVMTVVVVVVVVVGEQGTGMVRGGTVVYDSGTRERDFLGCGSGVTFLLVVVGVTRGLPYAPPCLTSSLEVMEVSPTEDLALRPRIDTRRTPQSH